MVLDARKSYRPWGDVNPGVFIKLRSIPSLGLDRRNMLSLLLDAEIPKTLRIRTAKSSYAKCAILSSGRIRFVLDLKASLKASEI